MTVVLRTIAEVRAALAGQQVALVPTMGALHDGHLSLVRLARAHAQNVLVSIFVNPTQFGPGEDFERYPRTIDADVAVLEAEGVDWVFAPSVAEMYGSVAEMQRTHVRAGAAANQFEGAARPGHFDGVLTVVLKLLNIVQPDVAVFGQKDAQQLALIRQMVSDFNIAVQIVAAPISRDADGLARSSRNQYLTEAQRAAAPAIWRGLQRAAAALSEQDVEAALECGRAEIRAEHELEIEYFELVNPESFTPIRELNRPALLLTVVRAGSTRLLDNLPLG